MRASGQVLLLDNGGVNKGYGRQPELKYETAMQAMSEMGYAAGNVGEQDLLLGLDYLKYVADFSGVPLLGANIVDADGKPVFQPSLSQQIQADDRAVTAAVIGVISTSFKERIESINPGIVVEEYASRLGQLIEKLRPQSDLLILLAHMSEDEACTVAERFPQIDLIVASHSGDDPFSVPIERGGVPIVFAGTGGMHLGVAKFSVGDGRPKLSAYSAGKLDGTVGDSPRMMSLLEDYQQMLRAENLLEHHPRTEHSLAKFIGSEKCRACHPTSFSLFQEDKHTHAFEALVRKKHEYDPECVSCHTVGFGYLSGFRSPDTTPALKNVGCENCHGPGGKHVENPLEEAYGAVTRETCIFCHNPENSPKFVYDEYLPRITPHSDPPTQG